MHLFSNLRTADAVSKLSLARLRRRAGHGSRISVSEMVEYTVAILSRPALFAVYGLSALIPRDKKLWAFGSWNGKRFADNSAALFNYAGGRDAEGVTCVWVSRDEQVVAALKASGRSAVHALSLEGMWIAARAGVFIFDGHTKDINHWLSLGAKRVHLQHGAGGFKPIERNITDPKHPVGAQFHGKVLQRICWYLLRPWHSTHLELVVTASRQQFDEALTAYAVTPEQTVISGLPRNDIFFISPTPPLTNPALMAWITEAKKINARILVHAPTFRDTGTRPFANFWDEFEPILRKHNLRCIAHQHYVSGRKHRGDYQSRGNHVWYLDAHEDLHPVLPFTDCLVTDFCSVSFDYLLLDKPIIYFVPDFREYLKNCRSLRFDFDEVAIGPLVKSAEELENALSHLPSHPEDRPKYEKVKRHFQAHLDSNNSQRVFDRILQLIQQ